jgi:hypothetical protein
MRTSIVVVPAMLCALVAPAYAAKSIKVTMNLITTDGVGKSVGTITIKEGKDGVTLEPKLKDLPPGEHGFHMHEKPSCDPADKEGKKTGHKFHRGLMRSHAKLSYEQARQLWNGMTDKIAVLNRRSGMRGSGTGQHWKICIIPRTATLTRTRSYALPTVRSSLLLKPSAGKEIATLLFWKYAWFFVDYVL